MEDELTIGQVARMAGVTVRTLHHYDSIKLVVPSSRSSNGYRQYGSAAVARLQEVLFYRELEFPLEEIKAIVDQPGYERGAALQQHRVLLEGRAERVFAMLEAVDRAINSERSGVNMTNEEMLEVFGGFDPSEHEAEAKGRWGHSDAYRESARRTASYTKDDWTAIGREVDDIYAGLVELMTAGIPVESAAAAGLVDRHRAHISRWFYDCTPEIHRGLGEMYAADPRFQDNIDTAGTGLAAYLSEAIAARYAD